MHDASEQSEGGRDRPAPRWLWLVRLGALVIVLLALAGLVRRLGGGELTVDAVRTAIADAGAFGLAVYVVSFVAALVAFIPPIVFVGLAAVVWGPWLGLLIGWWTGVLAVQVVFHLSRAVGGQLPPPGRPALERLLARLRERPVVSVVLIRLIFRLGPVVTATLALSPLRALHHAAGTAAGLFPWMVVGVFFIDALV